MPNAAVAEFYFIAAMMILIMVISGVAVYFFFRQYNLEKKNRAKKPQKPRVTEAEKEYVE